MRRKSVRGMDHKRKDTAGERWVESGRGKEVVRKMEFSNDATKSVCADKQL